MQRASANGGIFCQLVTDPKPAPGKQAGGNICPIHQVVADDVEQQDADTQVHQVLEENIDILHALTDLLMEKETVLGQELDSLIGTMRPDFDFFGKKNVFKTPESPVEQQDQTTPEDAEDDEEQIEIVDPDRDENDDGSALNDTKDPDAE